MRDYIYTRYLLVLPQKILYINVDVQIEVLYYRERLSLSLVLSFSLSLAISPTGVGATIRQPPRSSERPTQADRSETTKIKSGEAQQYCQNKRCVHRRDYHSTG